MPADLHASMRHIIDKSLVGETSPQEQQSLRDHLHGCLPCQKYADDSTRAIASLGGFSFAADPALQAKVFASLAQRAQQLQAKQQRRQRMALICISALLLTILGTWGALHAGSPLAVLLHLHPAQTQAGLFALWIVPSWCISLLLPVVLLSSARSTNRKGQTI